MTTTRTYTATVNGETHTRTTETMAYTHVVAIEQEKTQTWFISRWSNSEEAATKYATTMKNKGLKVLVLPVDEQVAVPATYQPEPAPALKPGTGDNYNAPKPRNLADPVDATPAKPAATKPTRRTKAPAGLTPKQADIIAKVQNVKGITDGALLKDYDTMDVLAARKALANGLTDADQKAIEAAHQRLASEPETFELNPDNVKTEHEQEKTMPKVTTEKPAKPVKPTKPARGAKPAATTATAPSKPSKPAPGGKGGKPGNTAPTKPQKPTAEANPDKAPAGPNGSQLKLLAALANSKEGLTREGLREGSGIQKGFAKLIGAATKGACEPGTLIGDGLITVETHEGTRGMVYKITKEGRKLVK